MNLEPSLRNNVADTVVADLRKAADDAWLGTEKTEKVPELLARRILREITQNRMSAGDRLPPEAQMLARFGVGRASLREALRILEIHGIIKIKPGPHGGPRITDMAPGDFGQTTTMYLQRSGATIRELLEARLMVEPRMARLAAQRLTETTAARIKRAAAWGWEAVDGSPEVWSAAAEEFHTVLAGASGNRVLDLQASSLITVERQRIGSVVTDRADRQRTLEVHEWIAQAVLGRDADKAEDLTRRHIQALVKILDSTDAQTMSETIEWR